MLLLLSPLLLLLLLPLLLPLLVLLEDRGEDEEEAAAGCGLPVGSVTMNSAAGVALCPLLLLWLVSLKEMGSRNEAI